MSGTLYVVGTPIGHLGDITRRAGRDFTGCRSDHCRRHAAHRALLSHLGIHGKPLQCVEAHADASAYVKSSSICLQGQSVALVTDAGMPAISDPGARLVTEAVAAGVNVQVVPGPSAVTAALSVSGIVEGPLFLGFLRGKAAAQICIMRATHCPECRGALRVSTSNRSNATRTRREATIAQRGALSRTHETARRSDAWNGGISR